MVLIIISVNLGILLSKKKVTGGFLRLRKSLGHTLLKTLFSSGVSNILNRVLFTVLAENPKHLICQEIA